ncbi:MAG: cobalamin-binding protein [Deltaproteobacteria bacterium]
MRICSFLPSATEILYALGLGESLVGVTHECDFPPEAAAKSRVIGSLISPEELRSAEIDRIVAENYKAGKSTYIVQEDALREASPDLIITQGLCEVCAVSGDAVRGAAAVLGAEPRILSLEPRNLDEILASIIAVGDATGKAAKAGELVSDLRSKIGRVKSTFADERDRPRVLAIEWLCPLYVGGHWVPEMIQIAGGECGLAVASKPSYKITWEQVLEYAPQMIVVMPCGFDIEKTLAEIDTLTSNPVWHRLPAVRRGHVYLVDANSYFSRPGPRVVDGLGILSKIIHPELSSYDLPANAVINLRNYMHLEASLG